MVDAPETVGMIQPMRVAGFASAIHALAVSSAMALTRKRTLDVNANASTQPAPHHRPASLPSDADQKRVYTEIS
jgi:hypothetical protein